VPDTIVHKRATAALLQTLQTRLRARPDANAVAGVALCCQHTRGEVWKTPDILVLKGKDARKERESLRKVQASAEPSVVIEVTCSDTLAEDLGEKKELYGRLWIREYFLFDPLGECLQPPLLGYTLIGEEYEPILPAKGEKLLSAELGLWLVAEGAMVALFDYRTGARVTTPPHEGKQPFVL
jgi:Uma2 family endonuclease